MKCFNCFDVYMLPLNIPYFYDSKRILIWMLYRKDWNKLLKSRSLSNLVFIFTIKRQKYFKWIKIIKSEILEIRNSLTLKFQTILLSLSLSLWPPEEFPDSPNFLWLSWLHWKWLFSSWLSLTVPTLLQLCLIVIVYIKHNEHLFEKAWEFLQNKK